MIRSLPSEGKLYTEADGGAIFRHSTTIEREVNKRAGAAEKFIDKNLSIE